MTKVLRILRSYPGASVPLIGAAGDRGCVSCGVVHQGEIEQHPAVEGDEDLVLDARGRYWCLDCAVDVLANVRRRVDDRTDYDYPWRFEDTGGLNGQHVRTALVACPRCYGSKKLYSARTDHRQTETNCNRCQGTGKITPASAT